MRPNSQAPKSISDPHFSHLHNNAWVFRRRQRYPCVLMHRFEPRESEVRGLTSKVWLTLAPLCDCVLSFPHLGVHFESMPRLTARLLLLFALAGNLAPLALAVTAAPLPACCLRKTHQCHGSLLADSDRLALHTSGCCSHDCCRAVTTSQWAYPQPRMTAIFACQVELQVAEARTSCPGADLSSSQSTRAPPADFLA
jgi:hypothetical protein